MSKQEGIFLLLTLITVALLGFTAGRAMAPQEPDCVHDEIIALNECVNLDDFADDASIDRLNAILERRGVRAR